MKLILLALIGLSSAPFLMPEPSALASTDAPLFDAPFADALDDEAGETASIPTPCDCPFGTTLIRGTVVQIRGTDPCYLLTNCDGPPNDVIVIGPIAGASVGSTVAVCGTFQSDSCNTNYDGWDIVTSSVVSDCDGCP